MLVTCRYVVNVMLLSILNVLQNVVDRMNNMKKLNEKKVAVTYRNKHFSAEELYRKEDTFRLSIYSPLLGVIVDWSCNDDLILFQVNKHFVRI